MPVPSGDLTDVDGVRVGHWSDPVGRTGCTVVLLADGGAVASVDVRGAAPGTRETDLLDPGNRVPVVHALLLTGGSAFGLSAADGVVRRLAERGIGLPTGGGPVPIVPAAVLFDLTEGSATSRPGPAAGYAAAVAAERGEPCGHGRLGAGTGATVGKLLGPGTAVPGGLGTASFDLPGGGTVAACAAVNAVGDVVASDGSTLGGPGTVDALLAGDRIGAAAGEHTTLVVVATDLRLTKTQARRVAVVAHDGLALAIRPVHTAYDGDTVFAVATGRCDREVDDAAVLVLQVAAVEVVARAIRSAVLPAR